MGKKKNPASGGSLGRAGNELRGSSPHIKTLSPVAQQLFAACADHQAAELDRRVHQVEQMRAVCAVLGAVEERYAVFDGCERHRWLLPRCPHCGAEFFVSEGGEISRLSAGADKPCASRSLIEVFIKDRTRRGQS